MREHGCRLSNYGSGSSRCSTYLMFGANGLGISPLKPLNPLSHCTNQLSGMSHAELPLKCIQKFLDFQTFWPENQPFPHGLHTVCVNLSRWRFETHGRIRFGHPPTCGIPRVLTTPSQDPTSSLLSREDEEYVF